MSAEKRDIWFPAKKRGYGWGPPAKWQGWAFLAAWIIAVMAGANYLVLRSTLWFLCFLVAMVAVLFAVCSAKGEPPRWRN